MGKLIGAFLRVLADYADDMDCERPEDIVSHIIANKVDIPVDALANLAKDMDTMQKVIGNIGLRVRNLEEKENHKCKIVSIKEK